MKVTEQQVERAAEAMFLSENPLAASGDWDGQQRAVYEGLARVALDALGDVEPEPLEDVLESITTGADITIRLVDLSVNHTGYMCTIDSAGEQIDGYGATRNAAIRNAVKAAKSL